MISPESCSKHAQCCKAGMACVSLDSSACSVCLICGRSTGRGVHTWPDFMHEVMKHLQGVGAAGHRRSGPQEAFSCRVKRW